jgi:protein O-GlcNAc transferase
VVTHIGNSFAGRVAASLLSAVGLPELITRTRADYEALAIELALDKQKLADIRGRLQGNHLTASLFDAALYARRLETAYEAMYQRHQAGLPPDISMFKRGDDEDDGRSHLMVRRANS